MSEPAATAPPPAPLQRDDGHGVGDGHLDSDNIPLQIRYPPPPGPPPPTAAVAAETQRQDQHQPQEQQQPIVLSSAAAVASASTTSAAVPASSEHELARTAQEHGEISNHQQAAPDSLSAPVQGSQDGGAAAEIPLEWTRHSQVPFFPPESPSKTRRQPEQSDVGSGAAGVDGQTTGNSLDANTQSPTLHLGHDQAQHSNPAAAQASNVGPSPTMTAAAPSKGKLASAEGSTPAPFPAPVPAPTAAPTAAASKQQEHGAYMAEVEDDEVPPPYTLVDEGIHRTPTASDVHSEHVPDTETGSAAIPVVATGADTLVAPELLRRETGATNNSLYVPLLPPRPGSSHSVSHSQPPPLPPRQPQPPSRVASAFPDDDPANPVHYTRDPHRLIGYLVPFPKPVINGVDPATIPTRFLIYTPPPPPLKAPAEGETEPRIIKMQRKWEAEVRAAKQSDAKLASWKGVRSRATKGISWAMGAVKSAELEFLNRVPVASSNSGASPARSPRLSPDGRHDQHADDGIEGNDHKTVGLEALDLVYPPSLMTDINGGEQELRAEFINNMMRTRSKAQRDAIIATGLLPVSAAVDILATFIWPFGGLLEVDGVWAYASIRGAKTARSVTKRLASSTATATTLTAAQTAQQVNATSPTTATAPGDTKQDTKESLALHFVPSSRVEVLRRYLAARCVERDATMFMSAARDPTLPPTETTVLSAIGWAPSRSSGGSGSATGAGETGGQQQQDKNWEDEQWETQEVKDDLRSVMTKAARSWDRWCRSYEKNPGKALKK